MTEASRHGVGEIATDPAVFEAFYREHLPVVRRYLARRVDDPAAVADLTADIFLASIRAAETYRTELGPPRAWLIGISRHVLADHRRSRARERAAIVELVAIDELSITEAAVVLGIRPGTARVRAGRRTRGRRASPPTPPAVVCRRGTGCCSRSAGYRGRQPTEADARLRRLRQ